MKFSPPDASRSSVGPWILACSVATARIEIHNGLWEHVWQAGYHFFLKVHGTRKGPQFVGTHVVCWWGQKLVTTSATRTRTKAGLHGKTLYSSVNWTELCVETLARKASSGQNDENHARECSLKFWSGAVAKVV